MRFLVVASLVVFSAALRGEAAAPHNPESSCLSLDSTTTAERTAYFTTLLSSTAADRARVRDAVGLPNVPDVRVHLVADSNICAAAVDALAAHQHESRARTGLVVYDLGAAGYAVEDPSLDAASGEYRPIWLFHADWGYRATLAGL
jgi:hypothetical protein